jgi:hypothetical protein
VAGIEAIFIVLESAPRDCLGRERKERLDGPDSVGRKVVSQTQGTLMRSFRQFVAEDATCPDCKCVIHPPDFSCPCNEPVNEDEGAGAPANSAGTGNIAGLGVNKAGKPANWGEPSPRKKRQQDEAEAPPVSKDATLQKSMSKHEPQINGSLAKNFTPDDIYHPEPDYSTQTPNELDIWVKTKGLPTHADWETNAEKRGHDNRPGWQGHPAVDEGQSDFDYGNDIIKELVAEGVDVKPTDSFAGAPVFSVDMDKVHKSRFGKNRYHRYSRYVGEDEVGEAIRKHGRNRKSGDIILKDSQTAVMTYLRRKPPVM